MRDRLYLRSTSFVLCVVVAVVGTALAWPAAARSEAPPARAENRPNAIGSWVFRFDVEGASGAVTEANIGRLELLRNGCSIRIRSNFNGLAHDHVVPDDKTPPTTSCTWVALSSPALDGRITATGVGAGETVISFVVAERGERLLLLLDSNPLPGPAGGGSEEVAGFVGTGEAFRR